MGSLDGSWHADTDYTFTQDESHSSWGYGNTETDYTVNTDTRLVHNESDGYYISGDDWSDGRGAGWYWEKHSEYDATWPEPTSRTPVSGGGAYSDSSSQDYWQWDAQNSLSTSSSDWSSGSATGLFHVLPGARVGPPLAESWGWTWTGTSYSSTTEGPMAGWGPGAYVLRMVDGTPTGPLTAQRTGNGQTLVTTLTDKYDAGDFFEDTRKGLLPAPGSPGAIGMPGISLYCGEMPARASGMEYHVGDSPAWGQQQEVTTTKCYWTADLGQLTLKRSEWWLEANDCLPGAAVTVVEMEEALTRTVPKVIQHILSITPGSRPGEVVTTAATPITSDVTGTMINRVRYLARLPVKLLVDANRDGSIDEGDVTTAAKPYRFWVNDDHDDLVNGEEQDAEVNNHEDWKDNSISCARDLEDFTRLWFNFGSLHPAISQGEIEIGIKWKNATGGPAIKIYEPIELAVT